MKPTIDVSALPSYAQGHRSLSWWGTMGFVAIEGFAFLLAIFTYFYLYLPVGRSTLGEPPGLLFGVLNLGVLLASVIPNARTKAAAAREDLAGVRHGLGLCLAAGAMFIAIRAFEFTTLGCSWDESAYGSIVWTIMGLHTLHLVTDVIDTAVLAALMLRGPVTPRRFADVAENAVYWNFVVGSWIVLFAVVYLTPRLV